MMDFRRGRSDAGNPGGLPAGGGRHVEGVVGRHAVGGGLGSRDLDAEVEGEVRASPKISPIPGCGRGSDYFRKANAAISTPPLHVRHSPEPIARSRRDGTASPGACDQTGDRTVRHGLRAHGAPVNKTEDRRGRGLHCTLGGG